MAVEVALLPHGFPAVRAVARCAILLGLLTAAYAAYCVRSPPCFIQCQCYDDLDAAALPRRLLWSSAGQAAAAALSLLLPGRARRALAILALAAGVASLAVLAMVLGVFTVYHLGATLLRAALVGEGSAIGVVITVVLGGFVAVIQGQE